MRRLFDTTRLLLALLVLSAALAGPAAAQAWPSKPVKLVNGYPAGGGVDILANHEPGLGDFQIVLLDQQWIHDTGKTVGQALKEGGFELLGFQRFAVAE